ncbi:FtsX-like permease family protein [Actinacidiphila acidipaludis]|uniref:ABC transporter permease n=1 Tax=Actinacidiphila acidipaludis TaxID=2873382 RepID=A0ABS7Q7L7_9ACTN|nr:ABC transporter permease [Streptomyces acidipaludis]MBY8879143.1 ABC transporter permease [Streptomyces acidipaludis]
MTGLARASIRHRSGGFVAAFVSVFLGAAILMAFASLLDTAGGPGVTDADRSALGIMASVVGGWGAVIVASAVATTVAVAARQRAGELALLRTVGATPGQVTRLLLGEVALVGLLGVVAAVPVGFGAGAGLLAALRHSGQIADGTHYRFGAAALSIGAGGCLVAALAAAWLTGRRWARRSARGALTEASAGGRRMSRFRLVAGILLVVAGVNCGVTTMTVMDGEQMVTQSVAAEGAILASLGFALLAPVLLRGAAALLAPLLAALGGPAAQLGMLGVRQRLQRAATPMMPIVVCTAISTGTLSMEAIWNGGRHPAAADDEGTEMLNYVVVGMIAVFAAVMLVNLLVAEIAGRRGEFARLRLTGATPRQILRLVGAETALVLVTGIVFGSVAALLTVVPYSVAVSDRALPDTSAGVYLAVVAGVVALTVATSMTATRRAVRRPMTGALRGAAS